MVKKNTKMITDLSEESQEVGGWSNGIGVPRKQAVGCRLWPCVFSSKLISTYYSNKIMTCWAWWLMPGTPVLRKLRQEKCHKLDVSLGQVPRVCSKNKNNLPNYKVVHVWTKKHTYHGPRHKAKNIGRQKNCCKICPKGSKTSRWGLPCKLNMLIGSEMSRLESGSFVLGFTLNFHICTHLTLKMKPGWGLSHTTSTSVQMTCLKFNEAHVNWKQWL